MRAFFRKERPANDRAPMTAAARLARGQARLKWIIRVMSIWLVFTFGAAVWHVTHVETWRKDAEGNITSVTHIETRRGDIVDRNGVTLATSLRADSVSANPLRVLPRKVNPHTKPEATKEENAAMWHEVFSRPEVVKIRHEVAARIATIVGLPESEIRGRLDSESSFVYLARHLDEKTSKDLRVAQAKGLLPGVTIEPEFVRYYPNNALAGALVGRPTQTGSIEASFDYLLRGQQVELRTYKDSTSAVLHVDGAPEPGLYRGHSLVLTIDEKIQAVAEHHLEAAVQEFQAEFAVAAVMDVNTAEVLALAVAPGVNPNDSKNKPKYGWHNIAIENQYEPGSTFKVFTLASALEEKAVTLEEVIPTGAGFVVGNKLIKDDHPHGQVTGLQALQVSSNIAMAKMVFRMPKEKFYDYLVRLGFGRRVDLGILGEGAGQLAQPGTWPRVQHANIAFGQGIAVTPLQMAAAYAALANGGTFRRPRIIRDELSPDRTHDRLFQVEAGRRVFSPETSRKMLLAMASVCEPRHGEGTLGGTGTQARVPNHRMGGKTGTAQQAAPGGGYSETHWISTFVGVVPIEKPRLVIVALVDTPKATYPGSTKVMRYGGLVAAPIAREIARFALPYLGVPPSPGAPYLDRNDPDKARREDEQRKVMADKAAEPLLGVVTARAAEPTDALRPGEVRVPDVRRLPMRVAREKLATAGLKLEARGSGVGATQGPPPGAVVRAGSLIHVTFRRLSEQADVPGQEVQAL